jgi:hypothetical protein
MVCWKSRFQSCCRYEYLRGTDGAEDKLNTARCNGHFKRGSGRIRFKKKGNNTAIWRGGMGWDVPLVALD